MENLVSITPLRQLSLDNLMAEAEALGNVFIRPTGTGWDNVDPRKGYEVELHGRIGHTVLKIKHEHTSLHCALADTINEAREMGLGGR